ncbi:MAG: diguanylate cyclase [Coprobacillus sp.]
MEPALEREIRYFIENMEYLYYKKRDVHSLLMYMDENITWIGTGKDEMVHGILNAQHALEMEIQECPDTFDILDQNIEITSLSDSLYSLYGSILLMCHNKQIGELFLHFTCICKHTDSSIKIMHIHFSTPDLGQKPGSYFIPENYRTEKENLIIELEEKNKQLNDLSKNMPGGVHRCENDGYFTLRDVSDSFYKMFGYNAQQVHDLFNDEYIQMIYYEDRALMIETINESLKYGNSFELEYRVQCFDGSLIWILDKGILLSTKEGQSYFYCILIEISDRKREQETLRLSLERHEIIMNQTTDIIFEWNIKEDTLFFSNNWKKKYGYNPISHNISSTIPLSSHIHPEDIHHFMTIMENSSHGIPYNETEFRIKDSTGNYVWNRIRATTQFGDNHKPIKAVGVIIDITEEKERIDKLSEMVQKDSLTDLYNKKAISFHINRYIDDRLSHSHTLFIIDIDDFKKVNDNFGHPCGDALLQNIAQTIKNSVSTNALIGRLGGDEFIVYIPHLISQEDANKQAQSLLKHLCEIKPLDNSYKISCSIGCVICNNCQVSYDDLYQYADTALYHKKNHGKCGVSFYNSDINDEGKSI